MLPKIAVEENARKHFLREMDVCRALDHPNIVRFFDSGDAVGTFFFVMEYCDGGSLDDLFKQRRRPLHWNEACNYILQALEGMAYAHGQQMVHRDLKPANILLSGGSAKVADFGLAKNFSQAGLSDFTVTGSAAGTLPFLPREQLINFRRVRPTSDVWSMAATLYYLVTGAFPRDLGGGRDPREVILNQDSVPLRTRDPSIPTSVAAVVDKALTTNELGRYPTAAEFHGALEKVLRS
jgi:serine/threonine protein kinase